MRIKSNTRIATIAAITADELGIKPSRAGWAVRTQQAERLARLLEAEERVSTHKPKAGKQAIAGRVRVERAEEMEEVADFNDEVEREYHWGVVCHTSDGQWYVTTAAESENRMDLNTVAVRHHSDRIIGVMGYWERDLRFAPIGRAHRDWASTDNRIILGWSADGEYYFYRK